MKLILIPILKLLPSRSPEHVLRGNPCGTYTPKKIYKLINEENIIQRCRPDLFWGFTYIWNRLFRSQRRK